ncbi:MAG: TRAP transporter small permease [Pseudomonadota bacterium]|nr:TRAP transporter small permease [Pseudomonadota bacterium]
MRNIGINRYVIRPLEWIAAVLLFAMMALTFLDVIGRYILQAPVFGAAEMIQFLLMGCVFSALGIASTTNAHIAVELISPALEAKYPRSFRFLVGLLSAGGLVLISKQLFSLAVEAVQHGRVSVVLEWPLAAVAFPSAVLCLVAALLLPFAGRDAR